MLVFGNVINIDEDKARVKLILPDYDNFETDWFFVPQLTTVKDKSYNMFEQNTLVAACCSEGFEDGCIIGAVYNDEDICILGDKNIKYIRFEDGSEVLYNKKEHFLNIKVEGDVFLTAENINSNGNFIHTGDLTVNGSISASGDISDNKGSMQKIRNTFNLHKNGGYPLTSERM